MAAYLVTITINYLQRLQSRVLAGTTVVALEHQVGQVGAHDRRQGRQFASGIAVTLDLRSSGISNQSAVEQ